MYSWRITLVSDAEEVTAAAAAAAKAAEEAAELQKWMAVELCSHAVHHGLGEVHEFEVDETTAPAAAPAAAPPWRAALDALYGAK